MTDQKLRPIIIKKKIIRAAGHHGGSWKVAYADFATAMMSLFIVLWLMNSNAKVKAAVAGYFKDPAGTGKLAGTDKEGRDKTVTPPGPPPAEAPKQDMEKLKTELEKTIHNLPNFPNLKGHIAITVTDEGVRMELMETTKGLFFDTGSPVPTQKGEEVLRAVSAAVGRMPNRVTIEGHTDSVPFIGAGPYGNWDLSSARANSARVLMQTSGLRRDQLFQIRGFADQQLKMPDKPADPSNRRISIIVLNLPNGMAPKAAKPVAAPPASPE
ncbi:MAG TPA: flagellar motor protein MotB [Bryobacteraceae bacterium]|nr:flagellar motor protein MotB [Bryobacteraceae bacterium]